MSRSHEWRRLDSEDEWRESDLAAEKFLRRRGRRSKSAALAYRPDLPDLRPWKPRRRGSGRAKFDWRIFQAALRQVQERAELMECRQRYLEAIGLNIRAHKCEAAGAVEVAQRLFELKFAALYAACKIAPTLFHLAPDENKPDGPVRIRFRSRNMMSLHVLRKDVPYLLALGVGSSGEL